MENQIYDSLIDLRNTYIQHQLQEDTLLTLLDLKIETPKIEIGSCLNLVLELVNISLKNENMISVKDVSRALYLFLSENNLDKYIDYKVNVEYLSDRINNYTKIDKLDTGNVGSSSVNKGLLNEPDKLPENTNKYFTAREIEIIIMTANGLKSKEISDILFVSTKTVSWNNYKKWDKFRHFLG